MMPQKPTFNEVQPWETLLTMGSSVFVTDRGKCLIQGWYFHGEPLKLVTDLRAALVIQDRVCAEAAVSSFLLTEDRRMNERVENLEARMAALESVDRDDEDRAPIHFPPRFGTFSIPSLALEAERVEVKFLGSYPSALRVRVVLFGQRLVRTT